MKVVGQGLNRVDAYGKVIIGNTIVINTRIKFIIKLYFIDLYLYLFKLSLLIQFMTLFY